MGYAAKVGVVTAVSFAVACTSILGDLEVGPNGDLNLDSGGTNAQGDAQVQQTADAGSDAAVTKVACERPEDCTGPMVPAACAKPDCVEHVCAYAAVDKDGDGHPLAGCTAAGVALPGDDCADDAPTIFPGGACAKRDDGTDIVFPNGTPIGACKAGAWTCDAGKAVCKGAVAPQPTENCTLKNDANCDGTLDDGCQCEPGKTGSCGNGAGLPLPCKSGTRTCSAEGKWGACSGNTEPKARDCSSAVDNDCKGGADQSEAACACPGNVAQGNKAKCAVPGGLGLCATGVWACQPSPDKQSGVFGPCNGPAPGPKDCSTAKDVDCNGVSDELDVGCGTPCLDRLGSGKIVAAAQKFANNIWGCAAVRNFGVRGAGCSGKLCTAQQWTDFIQGASPKPPTHKYWVANHLGYGGLPPSCYVPAADSTQCGPDSSMTVCPYSANGATSTDAEGNTCNWSGCSYGDSFKYNDYFGGCSGNNTGGSLCCN